MCIFCVYGMALYWPTLQQCDFRFGLFFRFRFRFANYFYVLVLQYFFVLVFVLVLPVIF